MQSNIQEFSCLLTYLFAEVVYDFIISMAKFTISTFSWASSLFWLAYHAMGPPSHLRAHFQNLDSISNMRSYQFWLVLLMTCHIVTHAIILWSDENWLFLCQFSTNFRFRLLLLLNFIQHFQFEVNRIASLCHDKLKLAVPS